MNNLIFLWQDAGTDIASQGTSPLFFPFMLLGLAIFYFFMIRPQAKEQKAQQDFSKSIKRGAKIVTIGGLHGTIVELEETQASLLIAPKTIITIQRSSISMELTKSVYGNANAKTNTTPATTTTQETDKVQ